MVWSPIDRSYELELEWTPTLLLMDGQCSRLQQPISISELVKDGVSSDQYTLVRGAKIRFTQIKILGMLILSRMIVYK